MTQIVWHCDRDNKLPVVDSVAHFKQRVPLCLSLSVTQQDITQVLLQLHDNRLGQVSG